MTVAKPQTLSVIDSISAGYTALNGRLWIVLIPIAFNLYLAFGTPVSIAPLIDQLRGFLAANQQRMTETAGTTAAEPFQLQLDDSSAKTDVRQPLLRLNFVPLLQGYVFDGGVPMAAPPLIPESDNNAYVVATVVQLLVVAILLYIGGLVSSALFLPQLATAVRGDEGREDVQRFLVRVWQIAWRILMWGLLLIAALIGLALPFGFVSAVILLLAPAILPFVLSLWFIAMFWVQIYIGFAIESMTLDEVGPLRALKNSVQVVRRNLLATLGLLLLMWFIGMGLGLVWHQISANTIGILLACAASAYIGTGLAAARMIFYRERLRRA